MSCLSIRPGRGPRAPQGSSLPAGGRLRDLEQAYGNKSRLHIGQQVMEDEAKVATRDLVHAAAEPPDVLMARYT